MPKFHMKLIDRLKSESDQYFNGVMNTDDPK